MSAARPLLERYEGLRDALPHLALGTLPTPVEPLADEALARCAASLYVKRDDVTGEAYGGNKVRKLEFALGEARAAGQDTVITFGTAGSNHALATSIYARACGMTSRSFLTHQSNASYVARNLLTGHWHGAELRAFPDDDAAFAAAREAVVEAGHEGRPPPYVLRGGGSSARGTLGFVNAGLELAMQVEAGLCPPPDVCVLPLGTMGTAVGLLLGLRAAGLATRLMLVRVVREDIGNRERFRRLAGETLAALRDMEPGFPAVELAADEPEIVHDFFGPGYARFTAPGMAAVARASRAGLKLEGTYTGKAYAALVDRLERGDFAGRHVLFWNTYSSRPLPAEALATDFRELPEDFHGYFTRPVQQLDPEAPR